jgi:hypothetical protein
MPIGSDRNAAADSTDRSDTVFLLIQKFEKIAIVVCEIRDNALHDQRDCSSISSNNERSFNCVYHHSDAIGYNASPVRHLAFYWIRGADLLAFSG